MMVQAADLALVFQLGGERYALPAADVLMVVEMGPLAPLPRLPLPIRGITHHRGRIVTVVDVNMLLGGAPTPLDGQCRLAVVEKAGHATGLLTGPVHGLASLAASGRSAPPRPGGPVVRVHLHQGHVINLLGISPLLSRILELGRLVGPPAPGRTPAESAAPVS